MWWTHARFVFGSLYVLQSRWFTLKETTNGTNGQVSKDLLAPDVPGPSKVPVTNGSLGRGGDNVLNSKWPVAHDLARSTAICCLEGEIADMFVLGDIPAEIDGTFYRVICDLFVPDGVGRE